MTLQPLGQLLAKMDHGPRDQTSAVLVPFGEGVPLGG